MSSEKFNIRLVGFFLASLIVHSAAIAVLDQYAEKPQPKPDDSVPVMLVDEPRRVSALPPPAAHKPAAREHYFKSQEAARVSPRPSQSPSAPAPPAASSSAGSPRGSADRDLIDLSAMPAPRARGTDKAAMRLVDPDVIEQAARKDEPKRGLSISTDEFKYMGYMRNLKARIEGIWVYPREAAARGITGDLEIEFLINRDGSLGRVRLARTSGYSSLDRSAMQALYDAAPFWPMPQEWEDKGIIIMGHFVYSGGAYYVK